MSELKVNSIKGTGASTAAITIDSSSGGCSANITNNLSNKNLIINGAMQVAQRGTSFTASGSFPVDRFEVGHSGTDEAPTIAQADVASGTTPYTLGFRKCYKITNGNQTSGAGSSDEIHISHKIEAQDFANSGWNYTSSSSFITLSFWVKSSVAQEFHGFLLTGNGTRQLYSFSLGSLTADTWTKITKTIPGNSNLTFNNDNGEGMNIRIACYKGSSTGSITQNQWATFDTNVRYPNYTSTWYTTNDATFEVTGFQLEVGSVATDFEFKSFGQELQLCKRYYEQFEPQLYVLARYNHSSGNCNQFYFFNVEKRAAPSGSSSGTFTSNSGYAGNPTFSQAKTFGIVIGSTNSASASGVLYLDSSGSATCKFSAEL